MASFLSGLSMLNIDLLANLSNHGDISLLMKSYGSKKLSMEKSPKDMDFICNMPKKAALLASK